MSLSLSMAFLSCPRFCALNLTREFNELVNMTARELEQYLKEEQSESLGWDKGDGSGETVGHER